MSAHSQKIYFVYIVTNRSKTLYTGVMNSLVRRVREHKLGIGSDFAARAMPLSARSKLRAG
jgi:predicted GIY-YIG superfamily endonuclease